MNKSTQRRDEYATYTGVRVIDLGTDSAVSVDYPDFARKVAAIESAVAAATPALAAAPPVSFLVPARFDARVARDGAIVLLEEQDRSAWNWNESSPSVPYTATMLPSRARRFRLTPMNRATFSARST